MNRRSFLALPAAATGTFPAELAEAFAWERVRERLEAATRVSIQDIRLDPEQKLITGTITYSFSLDGGRKFSEVKKT